MAEEVFIDLSFPTKGVDLSDAYGMQEPLSTREGVNVRVFEAQTRRGRGGSRQGLVRVTQDRAAAALIQDLNYVVDPTIVINGIPLTPGLLDEDVPVTSDYVNDPSDNPPGSDPSSGTDDRVRNYGRRVRNGGTGAQPNRNHNRPAPGGGGGGGGGGGTTMGTTVTALTGDLGFDVACVADLSAPSPVPGLTWAELAGTDPPDAVIGGPCSPADA